MTEVLKLEEQFAILSEAERSTAAVRVLKHDDSFAVFEPHGDIMAGPGSEHGLYHAGTRFLSGFELLLGSRQPLLLSSTISEDNTVFTADLTNPDIVQGGHVVLARGTLHLFRSRVLSNGYWAECLRISNHGLQPIQAPVAFRFDADFADVFEIRGTRRPVRGTLLPPGATPDVVLRYRGLDAVERRTRIHTTRSPDRTGDGALFFYVALEPHSSTDFEIAVACEIQEETRSPRPYVDIAAERREQIGARKDKVCSVLSSNDAFNHWIRRSWWDLQMMVTRTPHGAYPYAGIPWFSTPFGRDGIITALELLWLAPDLARGVLTFLAETQATTVNDAQDAQPGKIIHEMREGEMAALGEVPFGRYYGSADATPLFVMLADAYFERTGDLAFLNRLWPHVLAALDWIEQYGDLDNDGFIEYARRSESGLIQQGWKDSWDSVFHADGSLAAPPIAVCEIQGYAYAAWTGAARLAAARGEEQRVGEWNRRAASLQRRFEEEFWCEELASYALALDADKRPCRVATSNPGHCLYTGIASQSRATQMAGALMSDKSFAGWGVRTVAAGAARYNPMSYHNGSVWPHDNAIVAAGLARYGLMPAAAQIFKGMFALSQAVDFHRLPELICGFHRRSGDAPTLYPVACAPQAWAAGALYLLLQACLGLHIDATSRRVTFTHTVLPDEIEWLRIANLTVGDASVDLLLTRYATDVGVTVQRRDGHVEIVVSK